MISLVVPSRNRPANLDRLYQSWINTGSLGEFIAVLDDDDENEYGLWWARIIHRPRANAIQKINMGAEVAKGDIIGFCGDDCIIKTYRWERILESEMKAELSMVWVDDGHNKHNVPNHVFMTRKLYETLGWFAYPEIVHCYTDHVWRKIGNHIAKKPNGFFGKSKVVFYHDHPDYNGGERDEIYRQAYNAEQAAIDKQKYLTYQPKF